MSIALDGNGNSIREDSKPSADNNSERLADVVKRICALYDMNPKQALSYMLHLVEGHIRYAEFENKRLSGSK